MIDSAISHIANQLNQYLKRLSESTEEIVVISNLVEQDGNMAADVTNKIVVFLVNIQKDTGPYRQTPNTAAGSDRTVVTSPPLYLNVYLMVTGHFSHYPQALKMMSHAVSFFQRRPVFDHQHTPDLDRRIQRLVMEIENLSIQDLSNLWGVISGKYLPSILYKVRMVAFDAEDVTAYVPTVRETATSVTS